MASNTKNPMILSGANYIESWFTTHIKDEKIMGYFNSLETISSDKQVVTSLKKHYKNDKDYKNFEDRYNKVINSNE
jgi:hypothetical protein